MASAAFPNAATGAAAPPAGPAGPPIPGRSGATTVKRSASSGMTRRHSCELCGQPCSSTIVVAPDPARR